MTNKHGVLCVGGVSASASVCPSCQGQHLLPGSHFLLVACLCPEVPGLGVIQACTLRLTQCLPQSQAELPGE